MSKIFQILDIDSGEEVTRLAAGNGKHALSKYRHGRANSGFYELRKEMGRWVLCTTFGEYYVAREVC